jgi:hypothetical protein
MNKENLAPGDAYFWQGHRFVIILAIWNAQPATQQWDSAATYSTSKSGINFGGFQNESDIARKRVYEAK